jgi:hypothetical protein
VRGARGQYPGAFKSSPNTYGAKVWIDGELHYLGSFPTPQAASDYVKLVESRYPNRLSRPRGTLCRHKNKWVVRGPRPGRARLGRFWTRWEAEAALRRLGLRQ